MIRIAVLSVLASIYLFCVAGGIVWGSQLGDLVAGYSVPLFATMWIQSDSRKSGYWPSYHYGFWVLAVWPLLVPHYFWKAYGRSGIRPAILLLSLLWLPAVAAGLGWLFYEDLPDFRL